MVNLVGRRYIPFDKSWHIRLGILDMTRGRTDTIRFLMDQNWDDLPEDVQSLYYASIDWMSGKEKIRVGQSGTLMRPLQYFSWKKGLNKKFVRSGTLKRRKISDNPLIVDMPLEQLLKLDEGTSQWATAARLFGNRELMENPPRKLLLTDEAIAHYESRRAMDECWEPRYDRTIERQAYAFLRLLKEKRMDFEPHDAEDYCFARAFGKITREEGEKRWPQLAGHESNRLKAMERGIKISDAAGIIYSRDHRVVQALLMRGKHKGGDYYVVFPKSVNKSWPQFYRFMKDADKLARELPSFP